MAIRGSLAEASLGDVLQLLALGNKTGCLTVAGDGALGSVFFGQGRITHATVMAQRERFAERLLRAGLAERAEVAALVAEAGGPVDELRLARALAAADPAREQGVRDFLRQAVEEAVYALFTWSRGTFSFDPDVEPDAGAPWLSLSTESLLLEGARRLDEWSVVQRRIPGFDLVVELDEARLAGSGAPLSPEQVVVARWLDGTRDLAAVCAVTGLGEFEVGQAVYALLVAGLAVEVGRSGAAAPPVSEARVAEHRNLGIAFYRTAMFDEALREFRRVLELRPDDAVSIRHVGCIRIRQGDAAGAVAVLAPLAARPDASVAVHLDLALACELAGDLAGAEAALARAGSGDPRVHVARAQVALERGDLEGVERELALARDAWGPRAPSALWSHLAALSAGLAGDLARAQQLLEDGIAAHPTATALQNNLAVVLERRGAYEAGAAILEHALLQDASLPQLHKNLGDHLYRHARYDEADEAFERATRLAPALGPDVHLKRGNVAYRRGDAAGATAHWRRALALDPEHPIVRANLQAVPAADA